MAVILAPRYARKMSPFMFSASLVGALAEAGVAGVEPNASGAESMPEGMGPLMLE